MVRCRVNAVKRLILLVLVISMRLFDPAVGQGFDDAGEVDTRGDHHSESSRITNQQIPLMDAAQVRRPKPLLELGTPFQAPGTIEEGIRIPDGAVLQPSLLVFGTLRSAIQAFNNGETTFSEWANRLDLFANLQLTGTERILVGMRPLDEDGHFTGYRFNPNRHDGVEDEFNADITTFFFEGELGEMFPAADPRDTESLDWGLAVGRQPLLFQEGMLINDDIDAIGLVRNMILPEGGSNLRMTFLYGWNQIHRDDNQEDSSVQLFGVFTESDWPTSTVAVDVAYILDDDDRSDGVFWGISSVQRIRHVNTSFRLLGSHALDDESDAVSSGYLLFAEISWTPKKTEDLVYLTTFWGIDNFSSAARGPATGGPLGRTGILFAAVGLGRFGAPLGNRADQSVGGAAGYQLFLDGTRKQVVFELGGRHSTESNGDGALGVGTRYQQAMGQQAVLQVDLFGTIQESRDEGWGTRVEIRYEF